MKSVPRFMLSIGAFVWLVSILVTAAPSGQASSQQAQTGQQAQAGSQEPQPAPEDPRAALLAQLCFKCHDATRVLSTRRTRMEWEDTINKMIERGATGSGKEFETVFEYLLATYGKIYINDADADEIVKILGLSRKDADAIVAYRTTNGAFADPDAVRKVPGIDLKALELQFKAISI
jgi:competence ComEA-like helix-hairpin-helix protein